MHRFGFGFGYWIGPLICFLLVVGGLVLDILALVSLRKVKLSTIAAAIWAMTIVFFPVLGAVAYFIVLPHEAE